MDHFREQETYVHSRRAVEARIEEMITLLDMLDDDPDLEAVNEDGGDINDERHDELDEDGVEPSLGWQNGGCQSDGLLFSGARDDREEDAGDEREHDLDTNEGDTDRGMTVDDELGGDEEHALGWSEGQSLIGFHLCGSDDREEDLGWCNNVGQLRLGEGHGDGDSTAPERHGAGFVRCARDDHEDSHDAETVNEDGSDTGESDNGIGDLDGAHEQEGLLSIPSEFPPAWDNAYSGRLWPRPEGCHPQTIAMVVEGTCMEPLYFDGDVLAVEPVVPVAGEIACLFIEGIKIPQVKRLRADIPWMGHPNALVEFEMLNPPTYLAIPRHKLKDVRRVFGKIARDGLR